jgi:hypothetical protein
MRLAGWCALVLWSIGCGAARPVADRPTTAPTSTTCTEPPVTLHFAWPEALSARVVGRDLTESQNGDGSDPMTGDSYADLRLVVAPDGAGHTVTFETAGRSRTRTQGLAPDIGGARPVVHLDTTGAVVGVDGADQMAARVREALARGEIDRETASMILPNASDATQLGTAAAHWNWLLHAWDGRTLACGVAERSRAVVPSLSFGTATLDTETELELAGLANCGGAALGQHGCVGLEVRQRDVGGSARTAIEQSGLGDGAQVASATFVRTIAIVAEPDTLVLHSVVFEERWEISWRLRDRGFVRRIRDRQEYVFDYSAPRPPPTLAYVVTRDGQPMTRPDTPRCRWIDACCAALSAITPTASLMCAISAPEPGADCTADDIAAIRAIGFTVSPDAVPPACSVSAPP